MQVFAYSVRGGAINRFRKGAVRDNKTVYYQVSASVLDENTLARELAPLKQIKDNYPKFLITLDEFTGDHNGIQQVNLIDWLRF